MHPFEEYNGSSSSIDSPSMIQKADMEESHHFAVDFTSNQTDSEYFPFSIWSRLIRELLSDSQQKLMINPLRGILELREAIARHLKDFHGLHVSPEQIIIGAGTEYLYGILIQLLALTRNTPLRIRVITKSPKYTTATMWTVIILPWMTAASGFQNWRRKISMSFIFPLPISFQRVSPCLSEDDTNSLDGFKSAFPLYYRG